MDEDTLVKLLGICCRATCGCGNPLIPYTKCIDNDTLLLTCKPFSDKFEHSMLVAIPMDCQLIKEHDLMEKIQDATKKWSNGELSDYLFSCAIRGILGNGF